MSERFTYSSTEVDESVLDNRGEMISPHRDEISGDYIDIADIVKLVDGTEMRLVTETPEDLILRLSGIVRPSSRGFQN